MSEWEYQAVGWSFWSPRYDDWPGAAPYEERYQAEVKAMGRGLLRFNDRLEEDPDGLFDRYTEWRDDAENQYLDEVGRAGFELVALHREVLRESGFFPHILVRAYFKRPRSAEAPPMPRPIGFQAPSGETEEGGAT